MTELDLIHRDDDLALRWLPGTTGRLNVVFTGFRQGVGGGDLAEFAGSASQDGDAVLFVTDRRASWYSAPGLWHRILKFVRYVRLSERMTEIRAIGSSMGGFGALLLARDIAVARVIAFSPQVTRDPSVVADDRWPEVGETPSRDVGAETYPWTDYLLIASRGCAGDMAHLARIPDTPNVQRLLLPGAAHNAAGRLKALGLLPAVVAAGLRGARADAARLIETASRPRTETPT